MFSRLRRVFAKDQCKGLSLVGSLALTLMTCANERTSGATLERMPRMVQVVGSSSAGGSCVGVQIDQLHILSAAHCLKMKDLVIESREWKYPVNVSKTVLHANLDIGIARLAQASPILHPARLPQKCQDTTVAVRTCGPQKHVNWRTVKKSPITLKCRDHLCLAEDRYMPPGASGCPAYSHEAELVAIGYGWSRKGAHYACLTHRTVAELLLAVELGT